MARIDFVTGAPEQYAGLVDRLSTIPERLAALLVEHTDAVLRHEPPEGWSVQRVLNHLAFYAHANGVFIYQMATMTDPQRRPFPSGSEDPALASSSPGELLAIVTDAIGQTVALLARTPDAAWGRPGYVRGLRRSLRQVVQGHIDHFEEHLGQIESLLTTRAGARGL